MSRMEEDNKIIRYHLPCDSCGSSDALSEYSDESSYCFSCGKYTKGINNVSIEPKNNTNIRFTPVKGECSSLKSRSISKETCRKFKYQIGEHKNQIVHIANYYKDGRAVGQKIRTKDKQFIWLGGKNPGLYGMHLWKSEGRRVTITEGEIDCLTVSQLQPTWPTVSLPHGAAAAKKAIKDNLEWLEGFEEVVFMFDNDEAGEKAAVDCCGLLTPGKAKIATLPLKDASDMLQAGRSKEIITAIWNAKSYLPSGIINASALWKSIEKPIEFGLSYPWKVLTNLTYGIRLGEIITLGAGTGLGKTTVFKQVAYHLLTQHKEKIGLLFLEEANAMTALSLMSIEAGKPLHIPGNDYPALEKQECFDKLFGAGNVYMFDHFGSVNYEEIHTRIRYLAVSCGCNYIFLDHITALTSGGNQPDERKALDSIMTGLSSIVRELNICLFMISHLSTPDKGSHEEGGRVTIRQFRGSRSIGQWSSYVAALERDMQADDETKRHTSTFRILKDRYTGRSTGATFKLYFDNESQRLIEVNDTGKNEVDKVFNNEVGDFDDF